MRNFLLPVLTAAVALSTTACDQTRESLGLKRVQANEFEVMDRQPLSVPPNYSLRPPLPNAPAKTEVTPSEKAKEALLGDQANNETKSAAEKDFLKKAKAENVDHAVRATLEKEVPAKEEAAPGEALAFWKDGKEKKVGDVIDPRVENKAHNGQEFGQKQTS